MDVNVVLDELGPMATSVAEAVLPLAALFLIFQLTLLGLPRKAIGNILTGTLMSAAGLFLFLIGVEIGFLPFGRAIGEALGALQNAWLVVIVGFFLGFVTTWGEPAVRIFADQVDDASSGSISRRTVLYTVCAGVAVWVGVGMLRIVYGIPLLYLLLPGYALVIVVMWFCDSDFVAIAVDAGGVATGPMANTFLLALALGAAAAADGRSAVVDGLGLVSLIALAPMMSVMSLGVLIRRRERRKERRPC